MSASTPFRRGHKISVAIQLDPDQCEALDQIRAKRRTSRAALVREAVDLFLIKNNSEIDTQTAGADAKAAA